MICNNCGARIVNGLTECEFCGSPVDMVEADIGSTATQQSFVSLLSAEENKVLSSYMATGNYVTAQRFVMNAFGFDGQQAYEVVKHLAEYKDAMVPNVEILINNLTPTSKNVLYFNDDSEIIVKAKIGAQNKYLTKLGYTTDEKILLLYDNAIVKSGERGFTITNKGFYSSGSFLCGEAFYIPLHEIKTTRVNGSTLFVNEKEVNIVLIDAEDYFKVCAIVSRIIRANR